MMNLKWNLQKVGGVKSLSTPYWGGGRECGYFVEHISILGCMGPTSILLSASILFYIVCLESKKSLQPTRVITSHSSRQSFFFYSTMFAANAN